MVGIGNFFAKLYNILHIEKAQRGGNHNVRGRNQECKGSGKFRSQARIQEKNLTGLLKSLSAESMEVWRHVPLQTFLDVHSLKLYFPRF